MNTVRTRMKSQTKGRFAVVVKVPAMIPRGICSDDSGPGVPVSTLEGTKLLDNSSKVQRTTRRRSQTHGKVRQETLVAQESLPSTTSQRVPPKVSSEELLVWFAIIGNTISASFTTMSIKSGLCMMMKLRRLFSVGMMFLPSVKKGIYNLRFYFLKL
ncbi:hypothetical protein LOK49_LG01G03859 [Camellia lanceoleosa]|uniref:Uncharacterized protein n=1 Tax=Camellia lanceoleosa TaxID=1840588 RepID=A0ACC0J0T9_9ERIC|nr:hypothetical protein LOK49_LG01G03859 [Camellia lanceoleosa]